MHNYFLDKENRKLKKALGLKVDNEEREPGSAKSIGESLILDDSKLFGKVKITRMDCKKLQRL